MPLNVHLPAKADSVSASPLAMQTWPLPYSSLTGVQLFHHFSWAALMFLKPQTSAERSRTDREGARLWVTSSAQHSSIPPWQQPAANSSPGMALGRKVLSSGAPSTQESCFQTDLVVNYVQVSWHPLPEAINTKGLGRGGGGWKMGTGTSEGSQVTWNAAALKSGVKSRGKSQKLKNSPKYSQWCKKLRLRWICLCFSRECLGRSLSNLHRLERNT